MFTYIEVNKGRSLKSNAQPKSRKKWIAKRLTSVINEFGGHGQDLVVELLKMLARKEGMMFAKKSDFQLSVAQSLVLRDHVGTGTNGVYRMKQALKIFCPALKGIVLPPNIHQLLESLSRSRGKAGTG